MKGQKSLTTMSYLSCLLSTSTVIVGDTASHSHKFGSYIATDGTEVQTLPETNEKFPCDENL